MIAIMILMVLVVLAAVGYPLVYYRARKDITLNDTYDTMSEIMKKKESSYTAIKELDFDYRTGKLSDEDYKKLYRIYKSDALHTIRMIDENSATKSNPMERVLEEEIRRRRAMIAQKTVEKSALSTIRCTSCGAENRIANKYCTSCGEKFGEKCRKCGNLNLPDALFCSNCGEQLEQFCPQCGSIVTAGENICPKCGSIIPLEEEADR